MANKFVALLLLVSLVAAAQGEDDYLTPEQCYEYCFHAMLMPAPVAERICRWRCQYIMWASEGAQGSTKKTGLTKSMATAPVSAQEKEKVKQEMGKINA